MNLEINIKFDFSFEKHDFSSYNIICIENVNIDKLRAEIKQIHNIQWNAATSQEPKYTTALRSWLNWLLKESAKYKLQSELVYAAFYLKAAAWNV